MALAIDEYRTVVADEYAETAIRQSAAERCVGLLVSLGREEDLKALKRVLQSLSVSLSVSFPVPIGGNMEVLGTGGMGDGNEPGEKKVPKRRASGKGSFFMGFPPQQM